MLSALYGDLPKAKDEQAKEKEEAKKEGSWAGGHLMQPANLAAKRQGFMAPPSVLRAGRGRGREGPGPVAGPAGGRGRGPGPVAAGSSAAKEGAAVTAGSADGPITVLATALPTPAQSFGPDIKNEYDPARPNDYEAFCRQREQQRKEAEAEAERQERLREMRALEAMELEQQQQQQQQQQWAPPGGPAPASEEQRRAALSVSGEEAFARRGMPFQPAGAAPPAAAAGAAGTRDDGWLGVGVGGLGISGMGGGLGFAGAPGAPGAGLGAPGGGPSSAAAAPPASGGPKGMGLAQKMLEKMGWKAGEGLGRNRQGIAAPLILQKTDVRSGVIVSAEPPPAAPAPQEMAPPPAEIQQQIQQAAALAAQRAGVSLTGAPTRVLMLRNMVGPGEVDEKLDEEVGIECNKHGPVQDVVIFETKPMPPGFPEAQAVRIFVQFERVEGATKALVALQGRFFGGRQLYASFFDEQRFEKSDLAPRPEELQ